MIVLPLLLALLGIFLGRLFALKRGECPHRGKVWGAFLLPLIGLAVPELQFQALAISLTSALAAGLTAHASVVKTFAAVLVTGALATYGVFLTGF